MDEISKFELERSENNKQLMEDRDLKTLSNDWIEKVSRKKYSYNFTWMGRPIIQFPQDMIAMQEIIWELQPDLIVETGIAHGGSLVYYASLLELCGGSGHVVGIDIDIREHNRIKIQEHPMYKRITMLQGSSTDEEIVKKVFEIAKDKQKILVVLDSLHTHQHVMDELKLYSPLVKEGCYLVVFDTIIEDVADDLFLDRPWGKANNPKTAVRDFLKENDRFEIDKMIESKIMITVAPDGYLRCIKD